MPLLDLRPKFCSLERLHVSWLSHSYVGGLCSKILVEPHCSFFYRWSGAILTAIYSGFGTLFLVDPIITLLTESLVSALSLFPESRLFCFQFFQVSGCYQSWSHVAAQQDQISCLSLYGNHFGGHKAYMEILQESPAQLSSAIRLCSLALCFDLRIPYLLTPNLVTTFVCYPSFT